MEKFQLQCKTSFIPEAMHECDNRAFGLFSSRMHFNRLPCTPPACNSHAQCRAGKGHKETEESVLYPCPCG